MLKADQDKVLDEIFSVLAPGKPLRSAVDRVREASLGALIILTEPKEMEDLMEGGFTLDTEFSPQKLYELSKMDGAIIISDDVTKIYGANLHLQPNHNLKTDESGTRHRTAHRIAMQTGNMVVTISERRNKVTVFKGDFKYTLDSIADLLIKSTQSLMSLEKYATLTTNYLNNLNYLEYEKLVTHEDVIAVIRIFLLLFKTRDSVEYYIRELGDEGTTLKLQASEIMLGQDRNFINLIRDYYNKEVEKPLKPEKILNKLINMNTAEDNKILKLLGYDPKKVMLEDILVARGYRLLNSINKLNKRDVEGIIQEFKNINDILNASYDDFLQIKGINKIKGTVIVRTKERYKNILELEKF